MKRAFTLVEALIVIAILAMIAVFLLPVSTRWRSDPPNPTLICSSNLKQIVLGTTLYVQDTGGRFPPNRVTPSALWAYEIFPYVKNPQSYQCDKGSLGPVKTLTTDYFYNQRLSGVVSDKVKQTSRVILFGDGQDNAPPGNSWMGLPPSATINPNSPSQRHQQGAIYGFVDGHAKWIKPQDLSRQTQWKP